MIGLSRTAPEKWTLPSLKDAFMTVDNGWLLMYVMHSPGSVNDSYVENVLDDKHVDRLGLPTNKYKSYGEVKYA